ncbi:hypothetical protein ANO11243_057540 [Dothideomycetidae sp. 11243]|nr:hypothetical protein ANO11243_057540 [fungal sp. No.11243]
MGSPHCWLRAAKCVCVCVSVCGPGAAHIRHLDPGQLPVRPSCPYFHFSIEKCLEQPQSFGRAGLHWRRLWLWSSTLIQEEPQDAHNCPARAKEREGRNDADAPTPIPRLMVLNSIGFLSLGPASSSATSPSSLTLSSVTSSLIHYTSISPARSRRIAAPIARRPGPSPHPHLHPSSALRLL